jgi:hypothetical protein
MVVITVGVSGKLNQAHDQSCDNVLCKIEYMRSHSWSSLETVAPNQDGNGHARHAA